MVKNPSNTTKKSPQALQLERAARLEKLRAADRMKISKEEATRLRAKSLRRFKIFERTSFVVLGLFFAYVATQMMAALQPDAPNEALFNATLLAWGALALHAAIVIRTSVVRLSADDRISLDKTDNPFRGWLLTPFTPLLLIAFQTPALLSGAYNGEDSGVVVAFLLMLLLGYGALLSGALVAAFIIAPIELMVRGAIALVKGDKSRSNYFVAGAVITSLTVFIVLGTLSVSPDSPYPAGSFQVLLALFGIPGGYDIKDDTLLWITRGLLAAIIAFFVYVRIAGKRQVSEVTKIK